MRTIMMSIAIATSTKHQALSTMSAIRQFLSRVKSEGVKRPGAVKTVSMGRERTFEAFDVGDDTFVFKSGRNRDAWRTATPTENVEIRIRTEGYEQLIEEVRNVHLEG